MVLLSLVRYPRASKNHNYKHRQFRRGAPEMPKIPQQEHVAMRYYSFGRYRKSQKKRICILLKIVIRSLLENGGDKEGWRLLGRE